MTIRYLNVQSYTFDKEPALQRHLTENSPDIILISSTSRSTEYPIKIQSYNVFSVNKCGELHAGCAIAIKKGIIFEIKNNFFFDTIAATIQTSRGPIVVMTNYTPPRQYQIPQQDLDFLIRNQYPTIFAGDMNTRHEIFGYRNSSNSRGKQLAQHIYRDRINYIGPHFPIFYTRRSATTPDCILTNNKFFLNYHITSGGLGPSDHITIDILISANSIRAPCIPRDDIKNTNWDQYKQLLTNSEDIDLEGGNALNLVNEWKQLYIELDNAKTEATPQKTFDIKTNLKYTAKFRRLRKILDRYSKQLVRTGKTPHLERVIRDTQLALIQEGNICKMDWWDLQITKIEAAAKNNKQFWRQIKLNKGGKKRQQTNLEVKINGRNRITKNDKEKVQVFTNVWTKINMISNEENQNFCQETEQRVKQHLITNSHKITPKWNIQLDSIKDRNNRLPFTEYDVSRTIQYLANKAPGISKLKKIHFTNLPNNIIKKITHLFNCCYAIGLYPSQFKYAEIILIPKAEGSLKDPTNYRPISLINFMGKIFAKLLNEKLVKHLENNNIIKESQHGFRKHRSSTTLLTNLYERISREKANNKKTLISLVLRDTRKAFDKVWHQGLIYKIMQTGIESPMIRILANFLNNRKAHIKVNNEIGKTFNLKAGVPQGDVLSPTLYLIMCNDFPAPTQNNQSKNFCHQYADDFTQVIISKFNTNITDHSKEIHKNNIQSEINKQNDYDKKWKISTNMQKFQIIHIGVKVFPQIEIDNEIIPDTKSAKLLGLKFSNYNFFTKQINANKASANAELKKLYKFRYLPRKLKLRLYKSLVLPLLTYPLVPINACSKTQIKKLQTVQNKAIKWIMNEYWPTRCPLPQRHNDLKLEYLSERVKRLAEGVWNKVLDENSHFIQETFNMPTINSHSWFPSSYEATFN